MFIFLKNALGFWYINVYFFWSSFPFASQPLLRVCSVAEALPFAWHVLFCLTRSLTARVGHCLHFSCEGTTPQKGQVTCPRLHGLYVVQNTDSNPNRSDSSAQKTHLKFRVDSIYCSLLCMPLLSALICHSAYSAKFSIHRNLTKCRGLLSWHLENLKRLCFQMSPRTRQIWVGVWSVSIYRTP